MPGITTQHTEEALGRAFITALAGQAGCNYNLERGFDYGVDCSIRSVVVGDTGRRVETGFSIDLQLKSTVRWRHDGDEVVYALEAKTWNDLVGRDPAAVPLYLAVLCLPQLHADWVDFSEDATVLRHCCYHYRPPAGAAAISGSSTTIRIPRANLLTVGALHSLVADASAGR